MKNCAIVLLSCLLLAAVFSSCSASKEKTASEIKDKLAAFEKNLLENKKDTVALHELESKIESFANKYPDDTITAEFIYQLAGKQWQSGELNKAIMNYEKLTSSKINSYARTSLNDEAVIYLSTLNNVEKAKELFRKYLDLYKGQDAEETKMVEAELSTAGKTIDEIVKGWEEKKDTTAFKSR